jgi:hypothetical protein
MSKTQVLKGTGTGFSVNFPILNFQDRVELWCLHPDNFFQLFSVTNQGDHP